MESLSTKNENVKYLLCVIDVFTTYAWVKPLEDKKGKTVLNVFIAIVNESNCKPNKLRVYQGRELYNKSMREWFNNNDILMLSTHNEGKSVIAERFIKTLKSKIFKRMAANGRKSYLSYLNKLVDEYNNTYHHFTKKKPINADYSALAENIETNPKATEFKVNDRMRITEYKNILVKVTLKNGQEKYLLSILFWKLILGHIKLKI